MSGVSKLYLGNLPRDVKDGDIYDLLDRFKLKPSRVDLKMGFGFIQFDDPADVDEAIRELDGRDFLGVRLRAERSRSAPRVPGEGRCFKCGGEGHWARDCPDGGGGGGYGGGGRGRSRSPPRYRRRSPSPRYRSRSPPRYNRSRSPPRYRSRSPPRFRDEDRGGYGGRPRSRSPPVRRHSRSRSPPPKRARSRSRSPPRGRSPPRRSPSPRRSPGRY